MISSKFMQPNAGVHAVVPFASKETTEMSVCLLGYAGWTWLVHSSTRHQLCLCALLLLANVFSRDVMEGFPQSFFALD